MLMYGNATNIIDTGMIYNLTSLREGFERLHFLVPPNELGKLSGRDFDLAYANYIFSNDIVFKSFFDIIWLLYSGTDVYIIISDDEWSENLIESLLKLIQQRYGYNGCKISCYEDFIFRFNSSNYNDFDPRFGVANLDIDKERYTMIIETFRVRNGGPMFMGE